MKTQNKFAVALIPFLLVVIGCQFFGDPLIKLSGTVRNSQNVPLENASVSIYRLDGNVEVRADQERHTSAAGNFEFTFIGTVPKNAWLIVKKDGFKTVRKDLSLSNSNPNVVEINLESEK